MNKVKIINKPRNIDEEKTIKYVKEYLDDNRNYLQSRYTMLHRTLVSSGFQVSDIPRTNTGYIDYDSRLLNSIILSTDGLSSLIDLFVELSKDSKTNKEGIFLFEYYVLGKKKTEIYKEIGCASDKDTQRKIRNNAYILVAINLNMVFFNTTTIIKFSLKD